MWFNVLNLRQKNWSNRCSFCRWLRRALSHPGISWPILYDDDLNSIGKMLVFDEEFGYLTSLENQDSDDGAERGEL